MVMADAPMMIHVVEIGQQRNGRRHSPWARCYKHPAIANLFRFQRPDGKGGQRKLAGQQWRPFFYADQPKPDPEAWSDLMDADHVTPSLLHHITIAQPSARAASHVRAEILQVAMEMAAAAGDPPMDHPMARAACDPVWGPCPWQTACMREEPAEGIRELGLYQIRGVGASGRSSRPLQAQSDIEAIA
jgi:hypothetical protein